VNEVSENSFESKILVVGERGENASVKGGCGLQFSFLKARSRISCCFLCQKTTGLRNSTREDKTRGKRSERKICYMRPNRKRRFARFVVEIESEAFLVDSPCF